MTLWNSYYLAHDITDALQILAAASGEVRLVAGGTDLLLDIQQGRHPPQDTLVDVTRIAELCSLEIRGGRLFIGAALPLTQIVESALVYQHARALHESAGLIGGPQVRNTATLGGNVAHALPAADGTISLLALDAQAEVASLQSRRLVPLTDLFLEPGRSALEPRAEILVGFHLPLISPGQASASRRVMRPQGVAIAILNMAVWLARRGEIIEDVRIALGPAGPTPLRARRTEESLRGRPFGQQAIDQALQILLAEAHFRTSPHRATAEYRRHLAEILLEDTMTTAWRRAAEEGE